MELFGLKLVSPSGVTVLDPDAYTVRLVEATSFKHGEGIKYWSRYLPAEQRYITVPMSSAVRAGMFAVLSPMESYGAGMNLHDRHWGFGNITDPVEAGMPTATVQDGAVVLDLGPTDGYVNLALFIYVMAYE